jgi:hypothetical protein
VAKAIAKRPEATSEEIAEEVGVSPQRVRTTAAWKANRACLRARKAETSVRTQPLTSEMQAVIEAKNTNDPAHIAGANELVERIRTGNLSPENLEIVERQYLEWANQSQRAAYHELTIEEKNQHLLSWVANQITGMG